MKKHLIINICLIVLLIITGIVGCKSADEEESGPNIVEVKRGDIRVSVPVDGNLVMSRQVQLRFGTAGTVLEVAVKEGDKVKEGALLATLDNASQIIAIEKALYDLQLTINDLAEKASCGCRKKLIYPYCYPNTTALIIFKEALSEVQAAQDLLTQQYYKESAYKLRTAQLDMETSIGLLKAAMLDFETYQENLENLTNIEIELDLEEFTKLYPITTKAIEIIKENQGSLTNVHSLIADGSYVEAQALLSETQENLKEAERAVNNSVGQIDRHNTPYPDTATSIDFLQLARTTLEEMRGLVEQGDYDGVQLAEKLQLSRYDLEISGSALQKNVLVFEAGLNLTEAQIYNLNILKARTTLQSLKEELVKTEILAPFDGTVINVDVKEGDQLSAVDYSSRTAVRLIDTEQVVLEGNVDEIDIFQVELGQKASIIVDAMPDKELLGTVTFISPFGTSETGVVNFKVTIKLDPTDLELRGGLTATADVIAADRKNVLLIPVEAVIRAPIGNMALVVSETTVEPERRRLELGAESIEYVEVISGLDEGEKVLIIDRSALPQPGSQSGGGPPPGRGGGGLLRGGR
jgi:RND family efflux transporter MFP subunit